METWVYRDIRRKGVDITLMERGEDKPFAGRLVMMKLEDNQIIEPTVHLSFEEATVLMEELWNAGIRPSGVGTTGELASVRYHLEDMRTLVFKKGE